ncbi:uncharacterized membrane protein YjgN (DUF898 family) [Methylopila capsulata]|uniref:Membrane protein n=1 Tax=Methylopila capsulata TaxID=61654 RepID=A0A9W6IVP3_9HYPH|nr:DUF898 family protein [Methylopila capsulata]MBM7850691.1 uncharacterized membrane protein YjgN (DUF898 family) [Methylopila capsulata]GLK55986.1 membrane protein [Methylopila capsulata]
MDGGANGEWGAVRPRFHGAKRAMAPIVLKGLALSVVTLGVYRFWYQTDIRRFLWNNVEIDGDALEYTGRGLELFVGFLIALGVLIPLYGAAALLGIAAGAFGPLVQVGVSLLVVILAQYALYRARRYRLTRTIWRGVRLQQTGSGWAYAGRSLGWLIVAVVTLGLAYPWMRASLERFKMRNTWYGDQQGAFDGTGGQLFRKGVLLWLFAVVVGLGSAAAFLGVHYAASQEDLAAGRTAAAAGFFTITFYLTLFVTFPLLNAIEFRWWATACRIGAAQARCDLGLFAFLKTYIVFFGALLLLGLGVAAVGGALFASGAFADLIDFERAPSPIVIVLGLALYLGAALGASALWQLIGARGLWRKSFESVAILGLADLAAAQSAAPPANAFGEGVADALDFGGF